MRDGFLGSATGKGGAFLPGLCCPPCSCGSPRPRNDRTEILSWLVYRWLNYKRVGDVSISFRKAIERYEARLKEITARGQREANEFLELLEAEDRTVRSKRRDKRK